MFHKTKNPVEKAKHVWYYEYTFTMPSFLVFLLYEHSLLHDSIVCLWHPKAIAHYTYVHLLADDTFIGVGVSVGMLLLLVLLTVVVLIVVVVLMKGKAPHKQKRKMKIRGNLHNTVVVTVALKQGMGVKKK